MSLPQIRTKDIGLLIAAIGLILTVYEYWFSYPPLGLPNEVYFPISPDFDGLAIPLYSAAVLVLGILIVLGESGNKT